MSRFFLFHFIIPAIAAILLVELSNRNKTVSTIAVILFPALCPAVLLGVAWAVTGVEHGTSIFMATAAFFLTLLIYGTMRIDDGIEGGI